MDNYSSYRKLNTAFLTEKRAEKQRLSHAKACNLEKRIEVFYAYNS